MSTEFLESDDEGTSEHPPTKDLKTDKAVQEPEKKKMFQEKRSTRKRRKKQKFFFEVSKK